MTSTPHKTHVVMRSNEPCAHRMAKINIREKLIRFKAANTPLYNCHYILIPKITTSALKSVMKKWRGKWVNIKY